MMSITKQEAKGVVILFCDIVGFSTHSNDEQFTFIKELNEKISAVLYQYQQDINFLPTGDGAALLFYKWDSYKKEKLFILIQELIDWSQLRRIELRIGVHSGLVYPINDINNRPNACGTAINICQRIMDAANSRQVLFSKMAYLELVGQREEYQPDSFKSPVYFKGPFKILVKHGQQLEVYIMHMGDRNWNADPPFDHLLDPKIISGKVPRTRFIVDRLQNLLREKEGSLEIYEQAAFSTFSISRDHDAWKINPNYSKTYFELLTRQRKALDDLAKEKKHMLKLIIYPDPVPNSQRKRDGLKELIAWMESSASFENIDWVKADYEGVNRLIVVNRFYIEAQYIGYPGYEFSKIVEKSPEAIEKAVENFRNIFQRAKKDGQTKKSVIEGLRRQL